MSKLVKNNVFVYYYIIHLKQKKTSYILFYKINCKLKIICHFKIKYYFKILIVKT